MVRNSIYPPALAWNFAAFGLMVFLCGSAYSVSRAKAYQLELAQYKLQVGTVLSDVAKVSNTLEVSANNSAIAPAKKREIKKLTEKSQGIIEQTKQDIENQTEELLLLEKE